MKPNLSSSPRGSVLDDDVLDRLNEAIDPVALDREAHQRVKSKLLRRVAAAATPQHLTIQAGEGDWADFGPGLEIKVLNEDAGVMSYLVRMAPGSKLPSHRHPIDEECVVLEGEVWVGELRIPAGGFHLGRKNIVHDRVRTKTGALIFLRGAKPEPALVC
jgi:anti-sigma factor ChrR (cupin superfamily)